MRHGNVRIAILAVALGLNASPALALASSTYITYGGFTTLYPAFQNCAAIFGSSDYNGMLTGIALLGIMISALITVISKAERATPLAWVFTAFSGIVIFMGLFGPKDDLDIYDPVYNQDQVVVGLPVAVVVTAQISNLIEQFAVAVRDSIASGTTTACGTMPPLLYGTTGGSVAPALLAATASSTVQNATQAQYLMNYMSVCWTFELGRPGTGTTNDMLMSPGCGMTMLDVLQLAQNPAVFVTNPQNLQVSCTQAFTDIQTFYTNPANAGAASLNACGGSDFSDMAQCQSLIQSITNSTLGVNINSNDFILQQTLANLSTMALISGDASSVQQVAQVQQSNATSGILASVSNPQLINTYMACIIIMTPFIAMLLVAGNMWRKAFSLILSFFFFITVLRVMDVICFHLWASHYQSAMASAYNNDGLGSAVSMTLNTKISGMLNTLGYMRSSIATIATVVSGALFHFSDQGLARMGARLEAKSERTDNEFKDPGTASIQDQKQAGAREAMVAAIASGAHGLQNYAVAEEARISGDMGSSLGAYGAGGGTPGGHAGTQRDTASVELSKRAAGASMQSPQQAYDSGQAGAAVESNMTADQGMPFHGTENLQSGQTNYTGAGGSFSAKGDDVMGVNGSAGSGVKLEETRRQENSRALSNSEQIRDEQANSLTRDSALTHTNADGTTSVEKNGETLTYSKESARVVESAQRSAVQDALRNGATITDEKGNSVDQSLFAGATAKAGFTPLGIGVEASGGYKADVRTSDGHKYSVNMTGEQAKTFEKSYADRLSNSDKTGKSHSLSYDDSNSHRAETAATDSQRLANNYTHAASHVQEVRDSASESDSKSNAMGVNLETAFVKWDADKHHGGHGVQNTANSLEELKTMEADPKRAPELHGRMNQFLTESGLMVAPGATSHNPPPAVVNTAQTVSGLQENLRHGDHDAIKADSHQLTAMGSLVGKSADQLRSETPEQFNQDVLQTKSAFIQPGSNAVATIDNALHAPVSAVPKHLPGFQDTSGVVNNALVTGAASINSGAEDIKPPTLPPDNIRGQVHHTTPPHVVKDTPPAKLPEIENGKQAIANAGKNLAVTPMGHAMDKILTPLGHGEAPSAQGLKDGAHYSGKSAEERLVDNVVIAPAAAVATGASTFAKAALPIASSSQPIDGAQVISETIQGNAGFNDLPKPPPAQSTGLVSAADLQVEPQDHQSAGSVSPASSSQAGIRPGNNNPGGSTSGAKPGAVGTPPRPGGNQS